MFKALFKSRDGSRTVNIVTNSRPIAYKASIERLKKPGERLISLKQI